jgi:hypothetical protein
MLSYRARSARLSDRTTPFFAYFIVTLIAFIASRYLLALCVSCVFVASESTVLPQSGPFGLFFFAFLPTIAVLSFCRVSVRRLCRRPSLPAVLLFLVANVTFAVVLVALVHVVFGAVPAIGQVRVSSPWTGRTLETSVLTLGSALVTVLPLVGFVVASLIIAFLVTLEYVRRAASFILERIDEQADSPVALLAASLGVVAFVLAAAGNAFVTG